MEKIFIGKTEFPGGRIGESPSLGLTEQLASLGISTSRMKTGTPPRIDIRSINLNEAVIQYGDAAPDKFSYLPYLSAIQNGNPQMPCYIYHTNTRFMTFFVQGSMSLLCLLDLFMARDQGIVQALKTS